MDEKVLEREAMKLSTRDRVLLADALLESLDDDGAQRLQAEWAAEAEDRLSAYHQGDLSAVDGQEYLSELRSRYRT